MSGSSQVGLQERGTCSEQSSCRAVSDPLSDVIRWLGQADLADDILADLADDVAGAGTAQAGPCGNNDAGGATHRPLLSPFKALPVRATTSDEGAPTQMQSIFNSPHAYCTSSKPSSVVDPEEEEWDARQRQTGATGRLVSYDRLDFPREDFTLRGGNGKRVVVNAVMEGGIAARAGVKAGDVLVSIDGNKDFMERSAAELHSSLAPPVMLVFMGFVGKLQAEVRLQHKQKSCGLPTQDEVFLGSRDKPVRVSDEVIFRPCSATLILATRPDPPKPPPPPLPSPSDTGSAADDEYDGVAEEYGTGGPGGGESTGGTAEAPPPAAASDLVAVYELRVQEARNILNLAMSPRSRDPGAERYLPSSSIYPTKPTGDRAQLPRRITPALTPMAGGGRAPDLK